MNQISESYDGIQPSTVEKGAPAIALFLEDGAIYRARVLATVGSQYRVQFVDFGNVCLTDKVWPIENKFLELPEQAIHCTLGLSPAGESWGSAVTHFGDTEFVCQFISKAEDKT